MVVRLLETTGSLQGSQPVILSGAVLVFLTSLDLFLAVRWPPNPSSPPVHCPSTLLPTPFSLFSLPAPFFSSFLLKVLVSCVPCLLCFRRRTGCQSHLWLCHSVSLCQAFPPPRRLLRGTSIHFPIPACAFRCLTLGLTFENAGPCLSQPQLPPL